MEFFFHKLNKGAKYTENSSVYTGNACVQKKFKPESSLTLLIQFCSCHSLYINYGRCV